MKICYAYVFFLTVLAVRKANGGAIKAPLDIITLEDITKEERQELDAIGKHFERPKRSGSGSPDLLSSLKYILASGAKAKLRLLGRASAAASSSIASSSSSSKSYTDHGYVYHHPPEEENDSNAANFNEALKQTEIERIGRSSRPPKSDPWSSKKSVLNTLLQAVKAIKGGVLALKGQIIKGGGYLLVGGGNLVKAKGEVISNLGKKIARTAFRDIHPDHSSEVHEDISYGHHHPIATEYGPPSGPIHVDHDHFPHDFHDPYPDKTSGVQTGILIVKKAPSGKKPHSFHGQESQLASISAIEPEPHFGSIVGKLFSAASSSNPDSPAPFTDYKHSHPQPIQYTADENEHSDDSGQHDQGNFDSEFELEPAFDSPEANKIIEPQKSGEIKFGPQSFTDESDADNHSLPPKPPSAEQALPYISNDNFYVEQHHPQVSSTVHVNNDFVQQPPSENSHSDFTNINKPNTFQFGTKFESGHFAEPPSNNQNFLNTQYSLDSTNYIPKSPDYINSPQIFDHNIAEPSTANQGSSHQNSFPMNTKPYSPNIFDHNLSGPPKSLLHYESALNFQAPPKFEFEQQPPYFDHSSLTAGVKIDTDFENFVELRDKKYSLANWKENNKPHSTQSSRKPPSNYNKYRGVVRATPIVNKHIINPSSNLDLPHFSTNLKKFNPPKYPPFIERPSPSNKSFHGPSPQFNNKIKPYTSSKPGVGSSQSFRESPFPTRSRIHSLPNFDIVQSVTYQLGPNGPKMI